MPRIKDIAGERYGRLVAVRMTRVDHLYSSCWLCRCDCGAELEVSSKVLKSGKTRSCGCLRREVSALRATKHGAATGQLTPEYRAWGSMKTRCKYPNRKDYKWYGGRGITVCAEWIDNFAAFFACVGKRPSPSHSIDRIDVNGNYEPGNVRWATPTEQVRNRRCSPSNRGR